MKGDYDLHAEPVWALDASVQLQSKDALWLGVCICAYVQRPVGREKLAFEEGLLEVDLLRDIGTTIVVML